MTRFFSKLLNIRPAEWPRFLFFYMMLFTIFTGLIWGSIVVEASFLQQVGVQALPMFFVIKALVSIPAVALYAAFADRISNQRLLVAILAISSVVIFVGLVMISRGMVNVAYPLLYLLVFVPLDDILFTHWYTYVYGFYDTRASKRVAPVLATAGGLAGIFGGMTISLLNRLLTPSAIITIWAGSMLLVIGMVWLMPYVVKRQDDQEAETVVVASDETESYLENLREGFRYVIRSPFLRWMAFSSLLIMTFLALLEYRTGQILLGQYGNVRGFESVEEMSNFFGWLTSVTNMIVLPIQLFLLSRLINKVGLGNANLIYPVGAVAVCGGLLVAPGRFSAALAYMARIDLYNAFGYLPSSLMYNAVPLRVKGRARAFIGGLVVPMGALVGGVILLSPLANSDATISVLLMLLSFSILLVALSLRQQYSRALITMLEEEDFSSLLATDALDLTAVDPATLNRLKEKFTNSQSHEMSIFMAKLISQVAGREAVPFLSEAVRATEDPNLGAALLDVLVVADTGAAEVRQLYYEMVEHPHGRVRSSAFAGLDQLETLQDKQFRAVVERLVNDQDPDVQLRVLSALARNGALYDLKPAVQALSDMLADEENVTRRSNGVKLLGILADGRAMRNLIDYLNDPADEVRIEAIAAIESQVNEKRLPAELPPLLQDNLEFLLTDPVERVRQAAFTILGQIGEPQRQEALARGLADQSAAVRATAVDILVKLDRQAVPFVHIQLNASDSQMRKMAAMTLARINLREFGAHVTAHVTGNLIAIYRNHGYVESLNLCRQFPSVAILRDSLREQNEQLLDEIFYLLTALHEPTAVQIINQSLRSPDPRTQANAAEALEALTSPQTAQLVSPLFEKPLHNKRLITASREMWEMEPPHTAKLFRKLISGEEGGWLQTMAVFALGEIGADAWRANNGGVETPPPAPVEPPPPAEDPLAGLIPAGAKRRRRSSADLFNALMPGDQAEPTPPPAPPADEPEATTTIVGSYNAAEARRRIQEKQPTSDCEALFSLQEIEQLLADGLLANNVEVKLAAQAANRIITGQSIMAIALEGKIVLSTIEKIIFLKEVPFFQGMTIDQLKALASVCEEETFTAEKRIFEQGDPGGALYVIVNGKVGIEQEKRKGSFARLATLGPHNYFGEMNLFDNSGRSASAIALQDTLTLRLRREPLVALARQYPGLSLELINVLSARLRETSDRIADLTKTRPRELHKLFDQFD